MSSKTGKHGFAVGREVGGCGRFTRLALGLLGLILIGTALAQTGPSAATIGQIAGGLLLTAALYLILFWQLGGRIGHPSIWPDLRPEAVLLFARRDCQSSGELRAFPPVASSSTGTWLERGGWTQPGMGLSVCLKSRR